MTSSSRVDLGNGLGAAVEGRGGAVDVGGDRPDIGRRAGGHGHLLVVGQDVNGYVVGKPAVEVILIDVSVVLTPQPTTRID